ncbi:MAG TPA: DedA family protein [Chloroflexota bacterium]|nr:DedA family protein [Chloroflexota bacterium]
MDWWAQIRDAAMVFLDRHGLLAASVALLIEEAGVPLPFAPGDVIMLLLGVRARQGAVALWQVIVALEGVTLVGASLLYWVSRRMGRTLVLRYGRVLHLTPARLATAERWLEQHGIWAVVVARLVPGFRIAAAVGCGVLGVPFRVFFPGMAIGALLSILFFVLLGYALGPPALALVERVHVPLGPVGACLVLGLVAVWTARARRALRADPVARAEVARPVGRRWRIGAGAAAGAVATLTSSLLLYVLVHVIGNLAFLSPASLVAAAARRLPLALAGRGDPLLLLLALPAFIAVGVAWGALYGGAVEPRLRRRGLPDWAKGLAFAAVPLTLVLLVVLPVLGFGFPALTAADTRVDARALATAGEILRHLVYGLVLSLTFPVFLTRHVGRAAAAQNEHPPASRTVPRITLAKR